jgi:tryptophan-rich sensory protein
MIMSLLMRLAEALNQDDGQARRLNISLAVVVGLLSHALALWLGRGMNSDTAPWFALPAWMNAVVWLFLFALLGASRWMLNSYTIIGVATARTMVTVLILCCLLWPFYSLPIVDLRIALFANVATIVLAVGAIVIVRKRSVESASLVMPLTVWLAFSTIVVLAALGWL